MALACQRDSYMQEVKYFGVLVFVTDRFVLLHDHSVHTTVQTAVQCV